MAGKDKNNKLKGASQALLATLGQMGRLYSAGRFRDALLLAESTLAGQVVLKPPMAELLNIAGAAAMQMGNGGLAERYWRQGLAADAGRADIAGNLALLLQRLGRFAEAEAPSRQVAAAQPKVAGAQYQLAQLLMRLGRHEEAEALCRRVVGLDKKHVEACNSLGVLLMLRGQAEAAEAALRQALAVRPDYVESLNNLSVLLINRGRHGDAEPLCRRAAELAPRQVDVQANLANVLQKNGAYAEAELAYQRTLELAPEHGDALGHWYELRRELCQWQGLEAVEARLLALIDSGKPLGVPPFQMLVLDGISPLQLRAVARQFAERQCVDVLARSPLTPKLAGPRARLRLAYLSADFHAHATVHLLSGVLEQHDRERFEVLLYSYGPDRESPQRQRLQAVASRFVDVRLESDEAVARRLLADEVDILIDLKGYTRDSRPGINAWRPAPVIVSWLGYPGTLGHERLADYLIGDAVVSPLAQAGQFSETLALLPHCYQPNDNRRVIGPRPSRAEAGLPEQGFVFGNFNQAYKHAPRFFRLYCRLLRDVPSSVLWLLQPGRAEAAEQLRQQAMAEGVEPQRLVFAPALPQAEHLGRLQLADLALDDFPCVSHTTASDALWAGVPLLTRPGDSFVSRVAASILTTMGLPELVVADDEAFVAQALELARQPARLAGLRERLRQARAASPLFDTAGFTRRLERLYERIWAQECDGQRQALAPES